MHKHAAAVKMLHFAGFPEDLHAWTHQQVLDGTHVCQCAMHRLLPANRCEYLSQHARLADMWLVAHATMLEQLHAHPLLLAQPRQVLSPARRLPKRA